MVVAFLSVLVVGDVLGLLDVGVCLVAIAAVQVGTCCCRIGARGLWLVKVLLEVLHVDVVAFVGRVGGLVMSDRRGGGRGSCGTGSGGSSGSDGGRGSGGACGSTTVVITVMSIMVSGMMSGVMAGVVASVVSAEVGVLGRVAHVVSWPEELRLVVAVVAGRLVEAVHGLGGGDGSCGRGAGCGRCACSLVGVVAVVGVMEDRDVLGGGRREHSRLVVPVDWLVGVVSVVAVLLAACCRGCSGCRASGSSSAGRGRRTTCVVDVVTTMATVSSVDAVAAVVEASEASVIVLVASHWVAAALDAELPAQLCTEPIHVGLAKGGGQRQASHY